MVHPQYHYSQHRHPNTAQPATRGNRDSRPLVIQKRSYHHDEIKTKVLGRGMMCRHPHLARGSEGIKLQGIRGQVRVISYIRIPTSF